MQVHQLDHPSHQTEYRIPSPVIQALGIVSYLHVPDPVIVHQRMDRTFCSTDKLRCGRACCWPHLITHSHPGSLTAVPPHHLFFPTLVLATGSVGRNQSPLLRRLPHGCLNPVSQSVARRYSRRSAHSYDSDLHDNCSSPHHLPLSGCKPPTASEHCVAMSTTQASPATHLDDLD